MPPATTGTTAPPVQAPAAPAAPASPAASPASPPATPLNDAFSQLDSFSDDSGAGDASAHAPVPPPEPAATSQGPKSAPATRTPSPPKGPAAPAAPKAPDQKPPADKAPAYDLDKDLNKMPKQMRQAYDQMKARTRELEAKVEELSKPKPPAEDPEKKELAQRLEAREKRLQEIEQERKFVDYEHTQDYKDNYYTPYVEAFQSARERVSSLMVNVEGEERQGTPADFDNLMRIQDENAAGDYATEVFGNKAPLVLMHREKILELNSKRVRAIDHYKVHGAELEKAKAAHAQKQNEAMASQFKQAVEAAAEKYPHWFKPTEGEHLDPKINEALERGYKLVDQLYQPNNLTDEQRVHLHAAIRNKAGAFDRVALELRNAKKQMSELQARLDEYERSEPQAGVRRGATGGQELDWQSQLDALQA